MYCWNVRWIMQLKLHTILALSNQKEFWSSLKPSSWLMLPYVQKFQCYDVLGAIDVGHLRGLKLSSSRCNTAILSLARQWILHRKYPVNCVVESHSCFVYSRNRPDWRPPPPVDNCVPNDLTFSLFERWQRLGVYLMRNPSYQNHALTVQLCCQWR